MEQEKFNPLNPIGKTVREAKEYLEKFGLECRFENATHGVIGVTSIATNYNEGIHFYKCYSYNITEPDERIVTSFCGVTDKPLVCFSSPTNIVSLA